MTGLTGPIDLGAVNDGKCDHMLRASSGPALKPAPEPVPVWGGMNRPDQRAIRRAQQQANRQR